MQTSGDGYGYPSSAPRPTYADRTYSLPRTVIQHREQQQQMQNAYAGGQGGHPGGYYTTDRRSRSHQQPNGGGGPGAAAGNGTDTPDFYFMPSQRKYSGEVVRVYVDYNKEPKD